MSALFISYSRKDSEFVQWLNGVLEAKQRDVWVDFEDIPASADWEARINEGIKAANNFVFVISPDSVASRICGLELAHAIKNNKRLIPIVRREVLPQTINDDMTSRDWGGVTPKHWRILGKLNWIFFKEDSNLDQALEVLTRPLMPTWRISSGTLTISSARWKGTDATATGAMFCPYSAPE
jgi:hypothetical protein